MNDGFLAVQAALRGIWAESVPYLLQGERSQCDLVNFPVGSAWAPVSKAFLRSDVCFIFWTPEAGSVFPLELFLIQLKIKKKKKERSFQVHKPFFSSWGRNRVLRSQRGLRAVAWSSACRCRPYVWGCFEKTGGWESVRSHAPGSITAFSERGSFGTSVASFV